MRFDFVSFIAIITNNSDFYRAAAYCFGGQMELRIGTRRSRLAIAQSELVAERIEKIAPEVHVELVPMDTYGDKVRDRSLADIGGKGVFAMEIEAALLNGDIDLAVHSAKDLPMELVDGLVIAATLNREEPRDVLITRDGTRLSDMPAGSVIGTSSLRRELQLKEVNPGIVVRSLRGNVPTRIGKLRDGLYDGIVLAGAGLRRLELDHEEDLHYEEFSPEKFVPAAGQGILAVEGRKDDTEFKDILRELDEEDARRMLSFERSFMAAVGGSCNAPCGVYCHQQDGAFRASAMYVTPYGRLNRLVLEDISPEELEESAEELAGKLKKGFVSIVGAGPGSEKLITEAGLKKVREADVLVYDDLVDLSLINEAPLGCRLIYVGKRSGKHYRKQDEINSILVLEAENGAYVVRLKGGDPYIFGRGGEEVLALKREGIAYDVTPGVTSAAAVPEIAGIPVTHRGLARSFHVITGHEMKGGSGVDYEKLASLEGTLVFLMGLHALGNISRELISYGKDGNTPAAVISDGASVYERNVAGTLSDIAEKAEAAGMKTPAVIVIGDTVALDLKPDSAGKGPLYGKRVMITGSRDVCESMNRAFEGTGAELVNLSLIETEEMPQAEGTDDILSELGEYSWLVFRSRRGVKAFFSILKSKGKDLRSIAHMKIACIGKGTAEELNRIGFLCDLMPSVSRGAVLGKELAEKLQGSCERVLCITGTLARELDERGGRDPFSDALAEAGIPYRNIILYRTFPDERRREDLIREQERVDYIVLCSGSGAKAFSLFGGVSGKAKLTAIGPETAKIMKKLGLNPDLTAQVYNAEGVKQIILEDQNIEN